MATTIFLVRHGETDWNRERRVQGHSDVPLNDVGRVQAQALAKQLDGERFDAVYASDLARARETAEIAAAATGLAVRELVDLREKHFGSWEGLTDDAIRTRFPAAGTGAWGDGETTDEMSARVVAALRGIAAEHPGGNILVTTHGGPIRAALRASGTEPTGPIENCHVMRIEVALDGNLRRLD
jgi:broad specificity phosphatase PhoE